MGTAEEDTKKAEFTNIRMQVCNQIPANISIHNNHDIKHFIQSTLTLVC